MMRTSAGSALPLAALIAILPWSSPARAQATDSASVTVNIRVAPAAFVEFPEGFSFVLYVPEKKKNKWQDILPVLIPFRIEGNALASVSVRPDEFMPIHSGPYLGRAVREPGDRHKNDIGEGHDKQRGRGHHDDDGDEIGYDVIVQFPADSQHVASAEDWEGEGAAWDGFASLPGQDGVGTPALTADVSEHQDGVMGMIRIVAKHDWTRDGEAATPGEYRGAVEITVTAEER